MSNAFVALLVCAIGFSVIGTLFGAFLLGSPETFLKFFGLSMTAGFGMLTLAFITLLLGEAKE